MNVRDVPSTLGYISLRGVSKDYQRGRVTVPVLDRVDLDFGLGEFVALMGRSGSGKSTLLNLIGGLDQPSAGELRVGGVPIHRLGRRQLSQWRGRTVGLVFQFYNLLPALTAAQNVELPLMLQGVGAADRRRRVADALALVGLADRCDHRPAELSGGQQQRVAIARALVADPEILLCDEPTGDLDHANGMHVMEILRILHAEHGKTILVATHDPQVAAFAQRTLRLDALRAPEEAIA
ncbi:MAG: ABC transporter ATP-binding protein [Pseudomonadota bacterium]